MIKSIENKEIVKIHFIAIGGSAMHNLAIALHKKGHEVSGSDDEVFEPSRSRLEKYGLLPGYQGWAPEKIDPTIDAIILGMHAREDNPELLKAQKIGIKIYSYPEYLYEQTHDKTRIVIGGSHGKTTTTSMVMHVLKYHNIDFDYMVGAKIEGFETMVGLNNTSKVAVFEGDEYLSSPIDRRPKFHHYYPHIAVITGIAWDHINVFPTFEGYVEQFQLFCENIEKNGHLIYYENDENLKQIANNTNRNINIESYTTPHYIIENGQTILADKQKLVPLKIFGEHNLQNLQGAQKVCEKIGITKAMFFEAIQSFKGSSRRLEIIEENENAIVFHDFAHSPSKLKATVNAVKEQFPDRSLIAIMELHTFSSLKADFLPQYKASMDQAEQAYVYFNPQTIENKKLESITPEMVKLGFDNKKLKVFTNSKELVRQIKSISLKNCNLLIMSSGNFSGVNIKKLANELLS